MQEEEFKANVKKGPLIYK